jgi:endonuclease/exonuclease/phosphatase family metal-dependent hydrolase
VAGNVQGRPVLRFERLERIASSRGWSGSSPRGIVGEVVNSIRAIRLHSALFLVAFCVLCCTKAINYTEPAGPRFGGSAATRPDPEAAIRIVTFNVKFAEHVVEAAALLREEPNLRDADMVFLQEMDAPGARHIAEALSMNWVFYPAVIHGRTDRDFGNAILSRWPIVEDRKIILPHLGRFRRSQRIATAAVVEIDGRRTHLYSVHLALPLLVTPKGRQQQAQRILEDALRGHDPAIIAGDINWQKVGNVFEKAGFSWPSRNLGDTVLQFDLDHIFLRGFQLAQDPPVGIVRDNKGASDHRPVWAVVKPAYRRTAPAGGPVMATRDTSLGIENAAWISPTLLRGGRPGARSLATLKERGFRTIVNFTRDEDERREARRLGLDYYELPITAHLWSSVPTRTQLREFFLLTLDPARRPLLLHCAGGHDRTGLMSALYRIEAEGWTNGEAIQEMQGFGYHDWYKDLIDFARRYVPGEYGREIPAPR